jgi:DNA polymerase-3 subunit delta
MTTDELLAAAGRGEAPPVVLLWGEEDWLIQQAVDGLRAAEIFQVNPGLNTSLYWAGQTSAQEVLGAARTLPFLGSWRLIVVHEAGAWPAAEKARVIDYLADPCPSTCLVLTAVKLDGREKFSQAVKKAAAVIQFKRLNRRALADWLWKRAGLLGKDLDPDAAQALIDRLGTGLGELDSALDKAALFVGTAGRIRVADVTAVTTDTRSRSIFELTDALGAGRLEAALLALDKLLDLGEPESRILFMIVRHLRQLWTVEDLIASGAGRAEAGRTLGVPPFVAEKLFDQVRDRRPLPPDQAMPRLLRVDLALKGGLSAKRTVLERLLVDLCDGSR